MLKQSIDGGINFIDTATSTVKVYEEMTGKAFKELDYRDEIVLATKVRGNGRRTHDSGLSKKHILHQAEQSLKRLSNRLHRPVSNTWI
ncbi:MAG: aldo/keto reductase [Saprospiraceae bacterium]